ncbi:MAG TPA: hypothetical protein VGM52_17440 [Herbaspirillum sp.]|jgi:hypothetical protein
MNRLAMPAAILSAAVLLSGAAQAMEIQQFDKMAQDDRAEYVSELVSGAEKFLTDEGQTDQAGKIESLFTTNASDNRTSVGMNEFMITLAKARLADAQRALQEPNAKRVQVEDAMAVMLKNLHGITLPKSFFTVNSGFRPKLPPQ